MAEQQKGKRVLRKTESMRDKSVKSSNKKPSGARLRRTASAATRPIKAAHRTAKKEYHIITPKQQGLGSFLTKSRRFTPGYFRSSYQELKLVTWTSRRETWKLVIAVFIFSIAFGLVIAIVDFGLEKLFRKAFL